MRTLSPYGELEVKDIDASIKRHEDAVRVLQERRREVINRYSMNKKCSECKEENKQGQMVD